MVRVCRPSCIYNFVSKTVASVGEGDQKLSILRRRIETVSKDKKLLNNEVSFHSPENHVYKMSVF